MTIGDTLKREIGKANSLLEVSKGSGVPYGNVHRFVHGDTDLRLHNIQRLVDYFGYRLVKAKRRRG